MERRDSIYYWIVFLFNPFIAFILSLKRIREPIAMNIFWAFCVFYGYTFAIGAESANADIVRYVAEIKELWGQSLDWDNIVNYYKSTGEIDFYRSFMAVFLSRITESQRVITLFYAIVYGFFYSRNIWFVIRKLKTKLNFISIILLVALFLILPIWYINGVRMWTAMQMFIYGLLPFIWDGNRKKIIFLIASVLVHFSFYPMVLLFFCFVLLGPRLHLFFLFFCFSLFISTINLGAINSVIESVAPESFQVRTSGYRTKAALGSNRNSGKNWYVSGHHFALKWSLYISVIVLYVNRKIFFSYDKRLKKMFACTLFFFAAANFLSMMPSGGRYSRLPFFLVIALVLYIINEFSSKNFLRTTTFYLIPAFTLFIIVAFRIGVYSISATTLFANPVMMFIYEGETTSINDFIK